jgi:hypothetical protein
VKLTALPAVTQLVAQRQRLQDMVDAAELGLIDLRVGAAVAGVALVSVCHPAIVGECRAQICQIERELAALGVEID